MTLSLLNIRKQVGIATFHTNEEVFSSIRDRYGIYNN